MIYSKLEEMAKERANNILKEIERQKILLSAVLNPQKDIEALQQSLVENTLSYEKNSIALIIQKNLFKSLDEQSSSITSQLSILESKSTAVIAKQQSLLADVSKLTASIQDLSLIH